MIIIFKRNQNFDSNNKAPHNQVLTQYPEWPAMLLEQLKLRTGAKVMPPLGISSLEPYSCGIKVCYF